MRSRRWLTLLIALAVAAGVVYAATPYVRAASLIVRAANLGGQVEAFADARARDVTIRAPHMVPTRQGDVAARFYEPSGSVRPGSRQRSVNEGASSPSNDIASRFGTPRL